MGYKLMRMSYSSIIRESEDFGAALVDAEGRGLAESAQSTPLQSGPIPGYMCMLASSASLGSAADADPSRRRHHAQRRLLPAPAMGPTSPSSCRSSSQGRLDRLLAATTAHHLDIGALSPGSCGIVDAIDAYAEGLQFKAIKVYDRGVQQGRCRSGRSSHDNIRALPPRRRRHGRPGGGSAASAPSAWSRNWCAALRPRHGSNRPASLTLMDHAERLMRQAISGTAGWRLPRRDQAIDGYPRQRRSGHEVTCRSSATITVARSDDSLTVDLTGSAPAGAGPADQHAASSARSMSPIWLTIRSVLLDTEVHGHIPVNAGLIRPITIVAPKGCLANPTFPAPTIARFCPGNQLADTVMKALSQAMPGNVSAGIGNLKVIAFSGLKDETHWVHMEIFEGSYGGRLGKDGMDAVDTLYANTRNNPIEDIETHLPLRVLRYELREDVAGAGKWRGGLGSVREFAFLGDGGASVEGEGHRYRPWGFLGGREGVPAKLDLMVPGQPDRALPSKVPYMHIGKDGRFVCYGPAGGGYGNPLERDPADVVDDVLDGVISVETALRDYGVVVSAKGVVDAEATRKTRGG
jgi:N-methylhydantoinase B